MARKVEDWPDGKPRRGNYTKKYDKYLDGEIWEISLEEDFPELKNLDSLRSTIASKANSHGLSVMSTIWDDRLYFKAYKPEPEEGSDNGKSK